MYNIVLGRTQSELKKFGTKGTVMIGKQYVQMGQNYSLSNPIYLDVARAHAMLICGKRGGGKSYTMGSIAEGLADLSPDISKNLSFILLDTMGIYWSMKFPNAKEASLLKKWGLEPRGLDVIVYVPGDFYNKYLEDGIPVDFPFYISPKELSAEEWLKTLKLNIDNPVAVALQRVLKKLEKEKSYSIDDMIKVAEKDERIDEKTKLALINRLENTKSWGVFKKNSTPIKDILHPGKVVVIDLSSYVAMPGGWEIKALVLGIMSKKIFIERMMVRKKEELYDINKKTKVITKEQIKKDLPMPWLIIDEAHEFLPETGETAATNALMTILREGRQPGVSLILATQQPGKIHTDAITQSDIVLSHRITASFDLQSLDKIFMSYEIKGSRYLFNTMPRTKGCAIIMDDKNERLFTMQVRPRFTWHGGEDPSAIRTNKNEEIDFDL